MSSESENEDNFQEICCYFPAAEWAEISNYEKRSLLRTKENFHFLQRAGLNPKPPTFMRGRVYKWASSKQSTDTSSALEAEAAVNTTKKATSRKRRSSGADGSHGGGWTPGREESEVQRSSLQNRPIKSVPPGVSKKARAPAPPQGDAPQPSDSGEATTRCHRASASVECRYPRRAGARNKTYTEADPLDDDDYLSCDDCGCRWEGDCPEHGPLQTILDTAVAVGEADRALRTVPRQLAILPSKIKGAGDGVWAREAIPRRVRFGPYEGDSTPPDTESGYGWEIRRGGRPSHCVDATSLSTSNWMRFVNCARCSSEENLRPFQYKGRLYYRTTRQIPANTELLVWYGDSYGKELGIDPKAFREAPDDPRCLAGAFPCEDCGLCFVSPLLLSQHHRASRCITVRRRRQACGSVDPNAQLAALKPLDFNKPHDRTHADEKPHKCNACDAAFSYSSHLRRHVRTHTSERPYKCNACEAAFTQSSHLRTHVRTHTGERPYKCNACESAFTRSSLLRQHVRTHTGERPYKCNTCEAAFTRSSHLRTHVRTHTGERPYKCNACESAFTQSSNLRTHVRTHTGVNFKEH